MKEQSLGILAGMDKGALVTRTTTEPYATLWRYMVARWEAVAAREAETEGYLVHGGLGWQSFSPMLPEAALIFILTGRDDALEYVNRCTCYLLDEYEEIESIDNYRYEGEGNSKAWLWSHLAVALATDICRDALDAETRQRIAGVMRKCIDFNCMDRSLVGYGAGGNVNLARNTIAGICALTWGEESGHEHWKAVVDLACDAVHQYTRHGTDADGFMYEGNCYGVDVYSTLIFPYAQLMLQGGGRNLFAEIPVLEKVADAGQYMTMPDYEFTATTADGGSISPMGYWFLHLTAKHYNRPDHIGFWHAFQGPDHPIRPWGDNWPWRTLFRGGTEQEAIAAIGHTDITLPMTFLHYDAEAPNVATNASPLPTTVFGPGTGTATFRTSWNKNATFAILLGGGRNRACFGHAHADCGHFGINVGGEYLAVDTGRYNTNEDQHNVVLIDGQNRLPSSGAGEGMGFDISSGRFKRTERHALLDRCCTDASHMKNVIWALRDFFFVRLGGDDAYIIMLDNINVDAGKTPHSYHWQLNANPYAAIDITGNTTATVRGKNARLDCFFFQKPNKPVEDAPHEIRLRSDMAEWSWPYGRDCNMKQFEGWGTHFTVVERPRLIAEQETLSCVMASVVSPRRANQATIEITQFDVANGIGLEVKTEHYVDRFFAAPDHAYISSAYAHGVAEFAMERRTHAGEVVDCWVEQGGKVDFTMQPKALADLIAKTHA